MDFRKIVMDHLQQTGVKKSELANDIKHGCHPNTIYRYLRGDIDLSASRVGKLFDCLGIKHLINDEEKEN